MTPFIPFPSGSLSVSDPVVSITLEAAPVGFTPASYQWQEDAVDIPGETAATLALSDAASNLEGKTYSVEVSYTPTGGVITTRYYTASDTWSKPAGLVEVFVGAVGGGGGGGGGRRGAAASSRYGGGGGGGGAIVWRRIAAADLASTETVTIGAAGANGLGAGTDDTNGGAGGAGGDTSFGAHVVAKGGSGSNGGATGSPAVALGGAGNSCTPARGPFAVPGCSGALGALTAGVVATDGMLNTSSTSINGACPGGGSAAGLNASNAELNGGAGGGVYDVGSLQAGGAGGTANATRNGTNGTSNAANNWMFLTSSALTYGIGSGGGGGASESDGVTKAGNGGHGGNYGAGGGGGGASANGANSGDGGTGGTGLLIVIEVT